jgi:replication fork clamp-binding protein CrfC
LKKILVIMVAVLFILVGCGEESTKNVSFEDQANDVADMLKDIYESDGNMTDEELEKYKNFLDYDEIHDVQLDNDQLVVVLEMMNLADFLTGDNKPDRTFQDVYDDLMKELR